MKSFKTENDKSLIICYYDTPYESAFNYQIFIKESFTKAYIEVLGENLMEDLTALKESIESIIEDTSLR